MLRSETRRRYACCPSPRRRVPTVRPIHTSADEQMRRHNTVVACSDSDMVGGISQREFAGRGQTAGRGTVAVYVSRCRRKAPTNASRRSRPVWAWMPSFARRYGPVTEMAVEEEGAVADGPRLTLVTSCTESAPNWRPISRKPSCTFVRSCRSPSPAHTSRRRRDRSFRLVTAR